MSLATMYAAKAGSPKTTLAAALAAADTSMTLTDASVLPSAPNLAVIGSDESAEVVSYSAVAGNVVSGLVRGLGGTTASAWTAGAEVARNLTSLDHDTFRANILDLESRKANSADLGDLALKDAVALGTEVTGILPVTNGGTGAAVPFAARANLGLGSMATKDDATSDGAWLRKLATSGDTTTYSWTKGIELYGNHSQVFYVKTDGSDDNDGLTANTAFKTIKKAVDSLYAGGTINIYAGTYDENVTITGKILQIYTRLTKTSDISDTDRTVSVNSFTVKSSFLLMTLYDTDANNKNVPFIFKIAHSGSGSLAANWAASMIRLTGTRGNDSSASYYNTYSMVDVSLSTYASSAKNRGINLAGSFVSTADLNFSAKNLNLFMNLAASMINSVTTSFTGSGTNDYCFCGNRSYINISTAPTGFSTIIGTTGDYKSSGSMYKVGSTTSPTWS